MKKRPHILIFNPDEMRADGMHHLGNPASVTPNFDNLATREGVSFSRAFCQNPTCVPSRCSFFTGLYPHVSGHRTMGYLLHPGEENLFSQLRANGYYVWMNTRNDLLAGQYPEWAESHADEVYYRTGPTPPPPVNPDFRGEPGGKYYYSHFRGQLNTDENGRWYGPDDEDVDAAIDRILHPVDDRPMCMFLGLCAPHVPYQAEEPYFSAIDRSRLLPRILPEECRDKSRMTEKIREYLHMEDFTEAEWAELRAVYLAMCMKLDVQYGMIVDALKKAGIYDDTAIFVFSDHGDFTGDYGLVEKASNCFEDCLCHVPLMIKPPKGVDFTPGICDSLTELVDFYATAMDFTETAPTYTHFGKSLRPLLKDHSLKNRDFVCCEGGRTESEIHCDEYHSYTCDREAMDYFPKLLAQAEPEAHAKGIMLRTDRYKYISRTMGKDELYDLQADPGETVNRIDDPLLHEQLLQLQLRMLKWLESTSDIVPFYIDWRHTPRARFSMVKQTCPEENRDELLRLAESGADGFTLRQFCAECTARKNAEK